MYASKYTNELKPWEKFTQAAVYYLILLLLRVHLLYICSYSSSAAGIIFLLCIWVDLHLSAVDFTANKSYQEAERWSIKRLLSSWTELTNESQLETAVDPLGVQTRVKLSEWVSCFFFFSLQKPNRLHPQWEQKLTDQHSSSNLWYILSNIEARIQMRNIKFKD